MGAGIVMALDLVAQRKAQYKSGGIVYYRPWVFLITDGGPTDSVVEAGRRVREGEDSKKFAFYAVGVEDADMNCLKSIASPLRVPLRLNGLNFSEMFTWLSSSMSRVSQTELDQQAALAPVGWGTTPS